MAIDEEDVQRKIAGVITRNGFELVPMDLFGLMSGEAGETNPDAMTVAFNPVAWDPGEEPTMTMAHEAAHVVLRHGRGSPEDGQEHELGEAEAQIAGDQVVQDVLHRPSHGFSYFDHDPKIAALKAKATDRGMWAAHEIERQMGES